MKSSTISGLKDVTFYNQSNCIVYSNPDGIEFNVRFNLPCPKGFTIRFSDLNGREIKQYSSTESITCGETRSFKLIDNKGIKVVSGMYIVSVISDTFIQTSKILLLK